MTPEKRTIKVAALTHAKDHLERGMAVLSMEGYTEYSDVTKRAQCAIDLLKMDIRGLQSGRLPFVAVG